MKDLNEAIGHLRLSIISPSFNQAAFVRQTLDSIQAQDYPFIDHIIQDAVSTDGTVDILTDYAQRNPAVQLFVEKDGGQSDAINRGFARATGDIITWLNTDDTYVSPSVVSAVMKAFANDPTVDVVYGRGQFVDPDGNVLRNAFINTNPAALNDAFIRSVGILQPALFFRRELFRKFGPLDGALACAFDYEYWVRLAVNGVRFQFLDRQLAAATFHKDAKSTALRRRQLMESADVTLRHYGFASADWLNRAAESDLLGVNGIVDQQTTAKTQTAQDTAESLAAALFTRLNFSNRARFAMLSAARTASTEATLKRAKQTGLLDTSRIIATTFDDAYLPQGLSLIRSIRRHAASALPILVYNLNLSSESQAEIAALENVHLVDFPAEARLAYPTFLAPKSYGYKCVAIDDAARFADEGGHVLWVDAGVALIENPAAIFDVIERQDVMFIDHDDKESWPFYNGTFCHPAAAEAMSATTVELFGEHLCSCLIGYKVGGRFKDLFKDAAYYARMQSAIVWDKHPKAEDDEQGSVPRRSPNTLLARRTASQRGSGAHLSMQECRDQLGYLGHRQDQSVFSILAARYGAPIQSATKFCRSDDASSIASKLNWRSGSVSDDVQTQTEIPEHIRGAVTYHHRSTYLEQTPAPLSKTLHRTLVILGNGPSMKGFDFKRFRHFDSIGMNAAYRYWDEIGWYPTYYICLDKVVGLHHKDAIERLIRERARNGIRQFFLRKNLIDELPADVGHLDCVFDFDAMKPVTPLLSVMPITTGSHASLIGGLLGYERMVLMGIDCNYVEKVEGAEERGGTVLELTRVPADNPNYFFDGYQVAGDKFNIPNPSPDLHIESWRAAGQALKARGIKVWNGSAISKVDAFAKREFGEIESEAIIADQAHEVFEAPQGLSFNRAAGAHVDETAVIAKVLDGQRGRQHVMVDVGAHIGSSAAEFSRLGWRIVCFEPDPKNRAQLVARFGASGNVTIDRRAVSDAAETGRPYFASDESTGISGMLKFRPTHAEIAKVDVTTIAAAAEHYQITGIDFLKIDVEGYDFSVLKGVPWDVIQPAVIECEFEDAKTKLLGHSVDDIAAFLTAKGYAVYLSEWHPIIRYGIRHDWRRIIRYGDHKTASDAWGNILAFKFDPGLDVLTSEFEASIKFAAGSPRRQPSLTATASGGASARGFSKMSSLYTRVATSIERNNTTLLRVGRFVMWTLRKAVRHVGAVGASLAGLIAMIACALVSDTLRAPILFAVAILMAQAALVVLLVYASRGYRQRQQALVASVEKMRAIGAQQSKKIETAVAKFGALNGQRDLVNASVATANAAIARMSERDDEIAALKQQFQDATSALQQQLKSALAALELAKNKQLDLEESLSSQRVELSNTSAALLPLRSSVEAMPAVGQRLNDLTAVLARTPTFNAARYQSFNRRLMDDNTNRLMSWSDRLSLNTNARGLGYLADRICMLEASMHGRLATSIEDIMLRALITKAAAGEPRSVLEIGTLFGIGAAALHESTVFDQRGLHLTLLDPLDGYFGKEHADILTGQPVGEDVLMRNLKIANVDASNVTLVKRFSSDPEAIATVGGKRYDVLVIDGDHSFEGVKLDFEVYSRFVNSGGYIIVDDYKSPAWPGVTEYVDRFVMNNSRFEFVGAEWHTAVFRATQPLN